MKIETQWKIDKAHSMISFSVKHLMISNVKGSFTKFDASIYTTDKDFSQVKIELQIDVASISTGDYERDENLQSNDYFDVRNHDKIYFKSAQIEKGDDPGKQHLWGDLTIKGVTKRIMLNVVPGGMITDLSGNEKAGFKISGKINRTDWDLKWNQPLVVGGTLLSEEVEIVCDIELLNMNEEELIVDLDSRDDSYAKPL